MKKSLMVVAFAVLVGAGFFYQNHLVERGDLVVLKADGGSIFVDKRDRTITIKTSTFPVTLWMDEEGFVHSERNMIASYCAFITANLPANREEFALYQKYFL